MNSVSIKIYGSKLTPSQINAKLIDWSNDYPWYWEEPVISDTFDATVQVGDGIEDEWFIVGMLLRLTEEDANLVVQVEDLDGQFLLIEAAEHLPEWLEPETAEYRVWLQRGQVVIIPPAVMPNPSLKAALTCLRSQNLPASSNVQLAIRDRVTMAKDVKLHRHTVRLPEWAALVLHSHPRLVHHAARLGIELSKVPDINAPLVEVSLCFGRLQFARLLATEQVDARLLGGLELYAREHGVPEVPGTLPAVWPENDSLEWLNVAEDEVEMAIKDRAVNLNAKEEADLLSKWTEEFETGSPGEAEAMRRMASTVTKLESFLMGGSTAAHEGIDWLEEGSSDSSDVEEGDDDEEFAEREVLEAIKHDPDLLMRICEMMQGSEDLQWLMDSLTRIDLNSETSVPQKGLADIDPAKLAEARFKREVTLQKNDDDESDSGTDNSDGEVDLAGYTPTHADAKREGLTLVDSESDKEKEEEDLKDLVEDTSLMGLSEEQARLNLASCLMEVEDSGPLETIKSSLNKLV